MKLPSNDCFLPGLPSDLCSEWSFSLSQLRWFSGLLRGVQEVHSFRDWGTFNGGQITDGVWIKTAFKLSTFHFPWWLLIGSESSSAGRRWECWDLSVYVFQMLSRPCDWWVALNDQGWFCREVGAGAAPRANRHHRPLSLSWGILFLTESAYVSCSYKRDRILNFWSQPLPTEIIYYIVPRRQHCLFLFFTF